MIIATGGSLAPDALAEGASTPPLGALRWCEVRVPWPTPLLNRPGECKRGNGDGSYSAAGSEPCR